MTILLFPGQGAQKVGMARDLAERFAPARDMLASIDAALGAPITPLMWDGPDDDLVLTHNAQPAILAHSAAVLAALGDRVGTVVAAAGHSLGEYTAWVAAGSLSATDAARLVRRRGELMLEAGRQRPGAMAAVLGLDTAAVADACGEASTASSDVAVAANINAPDQTVISGDPAAVDRAGELCRSRGAKRVLPLKVSGAFHSPLMEPAVAGLGTALGGVAFGMPRFGVMANATASMVDTPDEATRLLCRQLTAPVRWVESMQALHAAHPDARWLELGPGSVLAGLLRRIVPGATCTSIGTAAEVDAFVEAA